MVSIYKDLYTAVYAESFDKTFVVAVGDDGRPKHAIGFYSGAPRPETTATYVRDWEDRTVFTQEMYSESHDMTFILRYTYEGEPTEGSLVAVDVTGFRQGK